MTREEQICMVQGFQYTPSEARFLVSVMLHSGYFLRRMYGCGRGESNDRLIRKLIENRHARASVFANNTNVYHVQYKGLYSAIDLEDIRHRKQHDPFQMRTKLMCLEYALLHPAAQFLPTEDEKIDYFHRTLGIEKEVLPYRDYTSADKTSVTRRFFVDKFPISTGSSVTFAYIDDGCGSALGFPTWLTQYCKLLDALIAPRIVYVAMTEAAFPRATRHFNLKYAKLAPMGADLLAYFELRKSIETTGAVGRTQAELDNFRRLTRRFAEHRHEDQYKAWAAPEATPAQTTAAVFSTYLLPHSYGFLGTLGGAKV